MAALFRMASASSALRDPSQAVIRVGIIGCGGVTQVIHLPTFALLAHLYKVTAVCDASPLAVKHAQEKFGIPNGFTDSRDLVKHADVDMVLICSPDEFHHDHIVEAIEAGKHVLAEKPMVLTREHLELVRKAQTANPGPLVGIGYMRRYAPAFLEFKKLLADSGPIRHVVVQDIIGPNESFVVQSGTYPLTFGDDIPASSQAQFRESASRIADGALGGAPRSTDARLVTVMRLLGSLGSHDLSLMRDALDGTPSRCLAAFANADGTFINAHFLYERPGGDSFAVQYSTGLHQVPTFDAHIEIWTDTRVLRIDYDTPFIKGLPITITIKENSGDGGLSQRVLLPTYKDAYTAELETFAQALHTRSAPSSAAADAALFKTSVEDAAQELDVWEMILEKL